MFSDPVIGDNFFGRQPVIDLLMKRAKALKSGYRQNVAIIGHQQMGKTSILRHFLHVNRDPEILCVYVEIKFQALDFFLDQFSRSLLYHHLILSQKVEASESLSILAQKALASIPQTVKRVHEITALLKSRHADEAYSKLFELTSSIQQETGKNCIVILDEFHRLGELGIKNAFTDFGKRIMLQKDTMYLLSSSSFSASRKILAEKLALLFGNFERVYLEPFDFGTADEFLEKKLLPVTISESLKNFLIAFTDGHPFFLDTLASRIRELALSKAEAPVSRTTVMEVFGRIFYESQGVLYQYFLKLISPWIQPNAHGSHLLILAEIARGKNKLKDIAQAVNRSQKETGRQIYELMGYELIVKSGIFYRFHNKIFKFWIREVYEKKERVFLNTAPDPEGFLSRVDRLIDEHDQVRALDVGDRVLKLFSLFNNEMVEFGEKRRRLPRFSEFISLDSGSSQAGLAARSVIAKGNGRCWVCKIVEEKATEKEVLDLVAQGAGLKGPSPTRVLVALGGLEENAKLLAKEKRVLTLGLSRINLLMDVYGKSPIIHAHPV